MGMSALAMVAAVQCATADSQVRLKGYLGDRLDAMIEKHVIGTDIEYITAPFLEKTEENWWWQTEFWGKYMHAAMPYLEYTKSEKLKKNIDAGIKRMLQSQEADGYIGNYPEAKRCSEGWDVWGIKYTMMGLLHYYDGTKDEKVLSACRKLCDYVIAEIGPGGKRGHELWQTGNWSGYASSSILEPVVWLYNRTGEQKYFDFASYIVKGMREPEGGPRLIDLALKGISVADRNDYGRQGKKGHSWAYVCKYGRSKAYEMMSCYQGLLEYYVTAKAKKIADPMLEDYLKAAVNSAEDIVKEEINLAGGCACSEAWFHGARKQHRPHMRLQETCVTTTWMRFCEKLLDVTGDPKWADQLERTFYNAYLGAMKADGSEFAGYTPLGGSRYHGQHHCYMHTDCCTANGPRGFIAFLNKLFDVEAEGAVFNFYTSALVSGVEPKSGKKIAFDMYSLYPRKAGARIVSHTCDVGEMEIKFRIPAWSANTRVALNGKAFDGVKKGSYFTVKHAWKLGDVIDISFEMPVVAHLLDHHVAFTRGPVLLARDSRFGDGDLSEVMRNSFHNGQKLNSFKSVVVPSAEMWMTFSATLPLGEHHHNPESSHDSTVFFCDYASAGNQWRRGNYYRTWFPIEYNNAE